MTDKEKLIALLQSPSCPDDLESIIVNHLTVHRNDFSATRIRSLLSRIDRDILMGKILDLEKAVKISSERATYLDMYLSGEMYLSEDEAKLMAPIQRNHAKEIKKVCETIPY